MSWTKMTDNRVTELYVQYREAYDFCDRMEVDGIKGDVLKEVRAAKNAYYKAWQMALERLESGE